jgi:4-hydroxybenzoate polyprenyltransferase
MGSRATDAEAKAALESIAQRRRQVIDEIDMPRWYWWGLALGWIALGAVTDLQHPWLTAVATLAFGAIHSSVSQRVISGRRRTNQLSVRADVAGRHTPLLMFGGLIALAGITIVVALAASAAGSGHPVTIASVVVALLILLGGPRLMAAVRRHAARSSAPA